MTFNPLHWLNAAYDADLSPGARGLAMVLLKHFNGDGVAYPSRTLLTSKMGRSWKTLRRWLGELVEAGLLDWSPRSTLFTATLKRTPVSTERTPVSDRSPPVSKADPANGHQCPDERTPVSVPPTPPYKEEPPKRTTTPNPLTEDPALSALDPSSSVVGASPVQEQKPPPTRIEDVSAPPDPTPEREEVLEGEGMAEIETRWNAAVAASPALSHHWPLIGLVREEIGKASPARIVELLEVIQCATDIGSLYKYALTILRKPEPKVYTPPPPPPPLDLSPLTPEQKQSGRGLLAQLRSALDDTDNAKVTA